MHGGKTFKIRSICFQVLMNKPISIQDSECFFPLLVIHNTNLNDSCRILSSPHNSTNRSGSKSQPFHLSNLKGWVLDPPCAIFLLSPQHPRAASPRLDWIFMSFCQGAFDATSKGVPWLAPNHSVHFPWPSKQTNKHIPPKLRLLPLNKNPWELVRIWSWSFWRIGQKVIIAGLQEEPVSLYSLGMTCFEHGKYRKKFEFINL